MDDLALSNDVRLHFILISFLSLKLKTGLL